MFLAPGLALKFNTLWFVVPQRQHILTVILILRHWANYLISVSLNFPIYTKGR